MAKNCCICGNKIGLLTDGSNVYFDWNKDLVICDECRFKLSQLRYIETYTNNRQDIFEYFKPFFVNPNVDQRVKNVLTKEISDAQKKIKKTELEKTQKENNYKKITIHNLLTTGYNFEGYNIIEYRGLVSGEVVLGTGFLSEFSASFSDFFGSESNKFADKIIDAKEAAKKKLVNNVINAGGNAVIGVDFDYIMFGNNMIGVSVNGTAVVVRRIGEE